jgi:microsomal dipeptidase-like Zn-dependent dipeptidase
MQSDALALLLNVGDADDAGCSRATELQNFVAAMRAPGVDQSLIETVCFKNWLRVLERT